MIVKHASLRSLQNKNCVYKCEFLFFSEFSVIQTGSEENRCFLLSLRTWLMNYIYMSLYTKVLFYQNSAVQLVTLLLRQSKGKCQLKSHICTRLHTSSLNAFPILQTKNVKSVSRVAKQLKIFFLYKHQQLRHLNTNQCWKVDISNAF